jgi:hypothetical protein
MTRLPAPTHPKGATTTPTGKPRPRRRLEHRDRHRAVHQACTVEYHPESKTVTERMLDFMRTFEDADNWAKPQDNPPWAQHDG